MGDDRRSYVDDVAPDLAAAAARHTGDGDLFDDLRIDEQLLKALDRKVCLPSGGSLVIDRTEAMTVVDVNTGKYVGSGGNLEETVTRNNLEAAEEIVRQLRLRDVGGIIVIDFIDMVLESNRELVLRRLTECLGRDRTKHQVAEVTSLGLVQMTRKRVGEGLLEAFSEPCEALQRPRRDRAHRAGRQAAAAADASRRRPTRGPASAASAGRGGGNGAATPADDGGRAAAPTTTSGAGRPARRSPRSTGAAARAARTPTRTAPDGDDGADGTARRRRCADAGRGRREPVAAGRASADGRGAGRTPSRPSDGRAAPSRRAGRRRRRAGDAAEPTADAASEASRAAAPAGRPAAAPRRRRAASRPAGAARCRPAAGRVLPRAARVP